MLAGLPQSAATGCRRSVPPGRLLRAFWLATGSFRAYFGHSAPERRHGLLQPCAFSGAAHVLSVAPWWEFRCLFGLVLLLRCQLRRWRCW